MIRTVKNIDELIENLQKIKQWHGNIGVEMLGDGFNVTPILMEYSYFTKTLRLRPNTSKLFTQRPHSA